MSTHMQTESRSQVATSLSACAHIAFGYASPSVIVPGSSFDAAAYPTHPRQDAQWLNDNQRGLTDGLKPEVSQELLMV